MRAPAIPRGACMSTVTIDQATRQYPGSNRPAMDTLEIADGECVVPSGCGMTTSLQMLARAGGQRSPGRRSHHPVAAGHARRRSRGQQFHGHCGVPFGIHGHHRRTGSGGPGQPCRGTRLDAFLCGSLVDREVADRVRGAEGGNRRPGQPEEPPAQERPRSPGRTRGRVASLLRYDRPASPRLSGAAISGAG